MSSPDKPPSSDTDAPDAMTTPSQADVVMIAEHCKSETTTASDQAASTATSFLEKLRFSLISIKDQSGTHLSNAFKHTKSAGSWAIFTAVPIAASMAFRSAGAACSWIGEGLVIGADNIDGVTNYSTRLSSFNARWARWSKSMSETHLKRSTSPGEEAKTEGERSTVEPSNIKTGQGSGV